MASKSLAFIVLGLSVLILFASPMADAQLGLIGGLLGPLLNLIRIQGIVYCTPNGNVGLTGASTPAFSNASVQLQCGGNVLSTATTNQNGLFSMVLDPISSILSSITSLISGCRLAVNTPLASCNASLPSVGGLVSTLQFLGTGLLGGLNVANLVPGGFAFNANAN